MYISKNDIEFIKRVQEAGDNNTSFGGSLLLNFIGIKRAIRDIDVIVNDPNIRQVAIINEYKKAKYGSNDHHVDFMKGVDNESINYDITYKGVPVGNLESLVKMKFKRGIERDYKDLNSIMRWVLMTDNPDIDKEKTLLTIIEGIELN